MPTRTNVDRVRKRFRASGSRAARIRSLAVCCVCLTGAVGCRPMRHAAGGLGFGGDWVQFTSQSAGFRASYPTTPEDKAGEGGKHTYEAVYDHGGRCMAVVYIPGADANVPLADRATALRDNLHIAGMSVSEVEVDGRRGLEACYDRVRDGQTYASRQRMFYAGGALYQVMGVVAKGSGGEADVERFVASFHFLPEQDRRPD